MVYSSLLNQQLLTNIWRPVNISTIKSIHCMTFNDHPHHVWILIFFPSRDQAEICGSNLPWQRLPLIWYNFKIKWIYWQKVTFNLLNEKTQVSQNSDTTLHWPTKTFLEVPITKAFQHSDLAQLNSMKLTLRLHLNYKGISQLIMVTP